MCGADWVFAKEIWTFLDELEHVADVIDNQRSVRAKIVDDMGIFGHRAVGVLPDTTVQHPSNFVNRALM